MKIEEMVSNMAMVLDNHVWHYNQYEREVVKKAWYNVFETTVISFNALLEISYGADEMERLKFPKQTAVYSKLREKGKW